MDKQTPTPLSNSASTNTIGSAMSPNLSNAEIVKEPTPADFNKFPYPTATDRLKRYDTNDKLFFGNHFDAFKVKVDNPIYGQDYARLRYVTANFAGLISKVAADMLFSEPISIVAEDGDQDWIDAFVYDNELHTQNYESALANSRHGDAVYKLRVGKRNLNDEQVQVIAEDITPRVYFPHLDGNNVRQDPDMEELAWVIVIGDKKYVRKELHRPGEIVNQLWKLDGNEIGEQVDLSLLNDPGLVEYVQTGIKRNLIVHIPNWKDGSSYFGYDDYSDLNSLFYALNNRLTKNDNILDKHSDPILALPEGVLDENGQVKKSSFHMFEISDSTVGTPAKPEYIVWNASLEASFSEIDKLMQFLYMFSETSPDAFGMGDGKVESGRALKLRLMRTIAKTARKRLYYDQGIKEVIYTAQLLAQAHNIKANVNGTKPVSLVKDPVIPEIIWADGLPVDNLEEAQLQELRLQSGTQSAKDAIKTLDNLDDEAAEKKAQEIKDETAVPMPTAAPKLPAPEATGYPNDLPAQADKNANTPPGKLASTNATNKG